jgi:putative permease
VKGVARIAAVSLATMMCAALLWNFRGAALLFLLSLVVAAAVRPFVDALEPRLGRGLALAVTYISGLGVLATFLYVVSHATLGEIETVFDGLSRGYERLRAAGDSLNAVNPVNPILGFVVRRLPPATEMGKLMGTERLSALVTQLLGVTLNILDLAGRILIVVALSLYWSSSREFFERLWMSLVPAVHRTRARDIWRAIESGVGAHVRSDVGQSLLAVLGLGVAFHLAALKTPMLPALAAGVFRLIPFVGTILAAMSGFAAGYADNLPMGIAAAAATLLVLMLLDRWVARRVFDARALSPTLVVFLIVALADAYGIVGVLIASPLAAALQIFVERLVANHPRRARRPITLDDVEARLGHVRLRLAGVLRPEESAGLGSVLARLTALVEEARQTIGPRLADEDSGLTPMPVGYRPDDPVARASAAEATLRSNTDWR